MAEENKQPNSASDIEELKKQAQEYLDGWKRAKADYLNLKKEMESQNKEIKDWMAKIMLLPLLNIVDGFDKALVEIPENLPPKADPPLAEKNDLWVKGIEGIKKQFENYIKTQGIEAMVAKGEKFDPMKHEAVELIEGGESGIVAEELQKGYIMNGEILRPVKVKVYK